MKKARNSSLRTSSAFPHTIVPDRSRVLHGGQERRLTACLFISDLDLLTLPEKQRTSGQASSHLERPARAGLLLFKDNTEVIPPATKPRQASGYQTQRGWKGQETGCPHSGRKFAPQGERPRAPCAFASHKLSSQVRMSECSRARAGRDPPARPTRTLQCAS